MKKNKSVSILLLLIVAAMIFTSGCGILSLNKKNYVKAYLDAGYKGEVKKYAKLTDTSEELLLENYEEGMKESAIQIAAMFGITSEQITDNLQIAMESFCKKLYKKASYRITDIKQPDKDKEIYEVTVSVKPITVFEDASSDVNKAIEKLQEETEEGTYNELMEDAYAEVYGKTVIEAMEPHIENTSYGDETAVTVRVEEAEEGIYKINEEDLQVLDEAIIQ